MERDQLGYPTNPLRYRPSDDETEIPGILEFLKKLHTI
jgi:hypothetical protein